MSTESSPLSESFQIIKFGLDIYVDNGGSGKVEKVSVWPIDPAPPHNKKTKEEPGKPKSDIYSVVEANDRGGFSITDLGEADYASLKEMLSKLKEKIGWSAATPEDRDNWRQIEKKNRYKFFLVVALAEQLLERRATISDFFNAQVNANTNNPDAVLHFMDYWRLREEWLRMMNGNGK